jgi:hypothetical protein
VKAAVLAVLALAVPACTTQLSGRADAAPTDAGRADAARFDALALDAAVPPAPDAALDAGADAGPPPALGRVIYAEGRAHSPITEDIAAALRAVPAGASDPHVLAKIGDSITVSTSFFHCFAGTRVDLAGRSELQPTIDWFLAGDAAGTDPFTRTSLAATVGWGASAPHAGAPSPRDREIAANQSRYASVMYGTNDVGFRTPFAFAANVLDITDRLLAAGAIPILSSIPPRDDDPAADARVPLFNLFVRGIAQGRGVPFVDFHRELVPLAGHGLGPDDVHPSTAPAGACSFTAASLAYGFDVRNLLVLGALDRTRHALDAEPAPDPSAPRIAGLGTHADPFVVDRFPFTDLRDTSASTEDVLDVYGCSTADESGPEIVYALDVPTAATLHVWLVDRGTVDVDLHVVDAGGTCLARNDQEISVSVPAGPYRLVLDTFVDATGVERAGEALVVLQLE